MEGNLFRVYVAAALGALVVYFAVSVDDLAEAVWQLFVWGAVAAILVGVRVHRPSLTGPWLLIAVGLALLAMGGTLNLPWWPEASLESRRVLADLASLVGYPLIGAGTAWFARAQSEGRDNGPVLDSIIVTIALTTVLWEGVFALHGSDSMETSSLVALLVLSLSASWVAAMATRMILAGGYRAPTGWLLFSSSVAGMAGAVAFLLGGGVGRLITGGPTDALWAAAVLLVAAAATHPSMTILTEPAPGIDEAHTMARILLPTFALAAPPVAVLLRQVATGETATVAAAASVVVAAVVLVRFVDLVRARERSRRDSSRRAVRQSALAKLGERGLAGTPLTELLAAAESVLRAELCVDDLRLEVADTPVEAEEGPGTVLAGSRGLVRLVSECPVELPDDTEDFVTSVGHVLAAAVKRHRDEEELRHRTLHDPLTGLANRALLDDRVRLALERRRVPGEALAVAFVDLDGFKEVNDTYGHSIGDQLLCVIADRLRESVRATDTVARFAGDEFVLVLDGIEAAAASELLDRVLAELRMPAQVGDHVLELTASVGLVVSEDATLTPDDLLRRADAAMYRAKRDGRDHVVQAQTEPCAVDPSGRPAA